MTAKDLLPACEKSIYINLSTQTKAAGVSSQQIAKI